jgi:hypothetical protein
MVAVAEEESINQAPGSMWLPQARRDKGPTSVRQRASQGNFSETTHFGGNFSETAMGSSNAQSADSVRQTAILGQLQ